MYAIKPHTNYHSIWSYIRIIRYKTHNTQEKLSTLTADSLTKMGVDDKERRKELMNAVREFKVAASQAGASSTGRASAPSQDKGREDGDEDETGDNVDAVDTDARRRAALDAFQESLKKDKVCTPTL